MDKARYDKVKEIIQREIDSEKLSTHEYNLLDNFLAEVRREMVKDVKLGPTTIYFFRGPCHICGAITNTKDAVKDRYMCDAHNF